MYHPGYGSFQNGLSPTLLLQHAVAALFPSFQRGWLWLSGTSEVGQNTSSSAGIFMASTPSRTCSSKLKVNNRSNPILFAGMGSSQVIMTRELCAIAQ